MSHWRLHFRYNFAPSRKGAILHPQVCTLYWGCKLCTWGAPSSLHFREGAKFCTLSWGCKVVPKVEPPVWHHFAPLKVQSCTPKVQLCTLYGSSLLHKWRKIAPLKVQTRVTLAAPLKVQYCTLTQRCNFAPYRRVQFCHLIGTSLPI